MKLIYLLSVLFVFSILASCKKSSDTGPATLIAKWNVVSDSTGFATSVVNGKTYKGQAGDYFDFRANGKCYTREGNVYDTLAYQMASDTTLIMPGFGSSWDNSFPRFVIPLTFHNATIYSGGPVSPGGNPFRILSLSR